MPAWSPPKLARGFLELLTGRTQGRTPQSVNDELQPVLDMREFYSSSQMFNTSGGSTVGALASLGDTLAFTATLGLKAIGCTLTIGAAAATNITVSLGIILPGSTERVPVGAIFIASAAAGAALDFGVIVPNWVMPPGSQVYARAAGTAAGADHDLDVHATIENYVSQV